MMRSYNPELAPVAFLGIVFLAFAMAAAGEIFTDSFESGDTCAWTREGCVEKAFLGTGRCLVFVPLDAGPIRVTALTTYESWNVLCHWPLDDIKGILRGPCPYRSCALCDDETRRLEVTDPSGQTEALAFSGGSFRLNPGTHRAEWSAERSWSKLPKISGAYAFTVTEDCEIE